MVDPALQKQMPSRSTFLLGPRLLRSLQGKTELSIFPPDISHLCRRFPADGFRRLQEEMSSVLTSKNLQCSWGDTMDAHGTRRVDVTMEKGSSVHGGTHLKA